MVGFFSLQSCFELVLIFCDRTIDNFEPAAAIATAVCLTTYQGDEKDFINTPLEEMVQQIKKGDLKIQIGKTFSLEQIVEAHRTMDENTAGGKIVLTM